MAPSYDGSTDPATIKLWKKRVQVWVCLAAADMPPEELGLRLWEALRGEAQRKIFDRDDEERYFHAEGVTRLIAEVDSIFGQDEMVDLGGRLDSFFEPARITRNENESVKEYIDHRPFRDYLSEGDGGRRELISQVSGSALDEGHEVGTEGSS